MKSEHRENLLVLLGEEQVLGVSGDKIMKLVEDIVRAERIDARKSGRKEGHEAGFTTGWDSALTSYMD